MASVGDLLDDGAARLAARRVGSCRLDAELLLAAAAGISRSSLLARRAEPVPGGVRERFEAYLARREEREPIAYILGVKEFWSLDFEVNHDVLVPRPDTEWVVHETLRVLGVRDEKAGEGPPPSPPIVVDVGTGAGPIAVAIARERPDAVVHATDVSVKALEVARRNAARHGVGNRIRFHQGDLLDPILTAGLEGRIDVVASNPPYVAELETVDPEVLRWEPRRAVFAGATGSEVIERLLPQAARALAPEGWLVMEIASGGKSTLLDLLDRAGGWGSVQVREDYARLPRVVTARRWGGGA